MSLPGCRLQLSAARCALGSNLQASHPFWRHLQGSNFRALFQSERVPVSSDPLAARISPAAYALVHGPVQPLQDPQQPLLPSGQVRAVVKLF